MIQTALFISVNSNSKAKSFSDGVSLNIQLFLPKNNLKQKEKPLPSFLNPCFKGLVPLSAGFISRPAIPLPMPPLPSFHKPFSFTLKEISSFLYIFK